MLKKMMSAAIVASLSIVALTGCEPAEKVSPADKVKAHLDNQAYYLTPEEMARARSVGKSYFEKNWPAGADETGAQKFARGYFNECKPSDSNTNGKVTCSGMLPNKTTGLIGDVVQVYCGYAPSVLGCSDDDK